MRFETDANICHGRWTLMEEIAEGKHTRTGHTPVMEPARLS
jgi:hypothetical protein